MKKNILSHNFWIGLVNPWLEIPSKTQTNLEVTENDYDDEWVRSGFSIISITVSYSCFQDFVRDLTL